MNSIFGIIIIAVVTFLSGLLAKNIPLSVPQSIYGIIILFLLLETGIVKKEWVKDVCKFLIKIMPLTFIPSAVALIDSFVDLKEMLPAVMAAIFISTVFVMATTGKFCENVLKLRRKK